MSAKTVTVKSSSGSGISGLLGVAFVVLKLTGYISWSWLWVLAPFWAPIALLLAMLMVLFVVATIVAVFK